MKIAVGSDHGGFEYKEAIIEHLKKQGIEVVNVGPSVKETVDYPIFGIEVGEAVRDNVADLGVVVCTSGEGITIAANKVEGIRAGIGYNDNVSRLLVEHNNGNVIGFGQAEMSLEDVLRRVDIFINAKFAGERHERRVNIIDNYKK